MMIHSIRGIRISLMGQTANMCARPPFHTWSFFPTPPAVPRRHSLRRGRAADTSAPVRMRRNICVGKCEERSLPLRCAGCYLLVCAANIWWTPGSYIVEALTETEGVSAGRWPGQSGGKQLAAVKGRREDEGRGTVQTESPLLIFITQVAWRRRGRNRTQLDLNVIPAPLGLPDTIKSSGRHCAPDRNLSVSTSTSPVHNIIQAKCIQSQSSFMSHGAEVRGTSQCDGR